MTLRLPGKTEERKFEVERQLKRIYLDANEPCPTMFDSIVESWAKRLDDVPPENIGECFDWAVRNNNKYKLVQVGQVVKAWMELRKVKLEKGDIAKPSTAKVHSPEWYQAAIDRCQVKYPEFNDVFSTINVNNAAPMDPRRNEDDGYFFKVFYQLYCNRFDKLADRFDMKNALRAA